MDKLIDTTNEILKIGHATHKQLERTQSILLTAILDANEVNIPTSFVILPSILDEDDEEYDEDDDKEDEEKLISEQVVETIEQGERWYNNLLQLGSNIKNTFNGCFEGALGTIRESVSNSVTEMVDSQETLYFYLVD